MALYISFTVRLSHDNHISCRGSNKSLSLLSSSTLSQQAVKMPVTCRLSSPIAPILRRLFVSSAENPPKHLDSDPLALDLALGLVLRVRRDRHLLPVDSPPTRLLAELGQRVPSQVQPAAQHTRFDLPERLAHLPGDSYPNQILEACDVGVQVCVEVVALERGPELGVLGGFEQGGEEGEFLDRFRKVGRWD